MTFIHTSMENLLDNQKINQQQLISKMNIIPTLWGSKYELDVPPIDRQHMSLFQLLDDLKGVIQRGDSDTINFSLTLGLLRQWADRHFASEETIMSIIGFPGAAGHSSQHQEFMRHLEEASFSTPHRANFIESVETLIDFIASWLDGHILAEDRQWATYLKTNFVRQNTA